ncbi:MAG: 2,3-bisphosphoglycerate-independent phosphoglycerate mutase [Patescibacteria group bacterium]|nr:2,3-bisphosphoglycerate-independent phosphoglycerate mutase [Patescibacteria group bacterium]
MTYNYRPIVLVILDGWGEWDTKMGNPVSCALLPTIDELDQYYPKILIEASSLAVGLPWGVFGNSEVGHQTIGSGQIIYHYLPTIIAAIQSRRFFNDETLLSAIKHVKKYDSALHLIGLLSDGGVHSHVDHLYALLQLAKEQGLNKVYIHALMDGRDTPPHEGKRFIEELTIQINKIGVGHLATMVGRYYTMDRNCNYDRVEKGLLACMQGEGIKTSDPLGELDKQYNDKKTDEYIEPVVLTGPDSNPIGLIQENDALINFNFRADRARQISYAITGQVKDKLGNLVMPDNLFYIGFSKYADDLDVPAVFSPQKITTRVGEILSRKNKKQLRIAETEKFAHVTYFFNGGLSDPFPGEERIFVPSKNVKSYATIPEMSAPEVTKKLLEAINSNKYDFILVNYANTDMVGHTGDFKAGVKTLEIVDIELKKVIKATLALNGCLLITADHGNIEEMLNLETGEIDTQHSTNPVPFRLVAKDFRFKEPVENQSKEIKGMLADIAATILDLFNIKKPTNMVGETLLDRFKNNLYDPHL